jgi:hypothetical protein
VKEFSKCCLSVDGTIVNNAAFVKNLVIFFDRTLHPVFLANTISNVLSWFNLSIFELIHTLTFDKQISRRLDILFQLSMI